MKIIIIFAMLNQNYHMIKQLINPDMNTIPERNGAVSVMMPLSISKSGFLLNNLTIKTMKKFKEKLVTKLVWALTKSIVYWCAIRLIANATTGKYSNQIVPELKAMDALKRWEY